MKIAILTPDKASFMRMIALLKKLHDVDWEGYSDGLAWTDGKYYNDTLTITKDWTGRTLSFSSSTFFSEHEFTILSEDEYKSRYCIPLSLNNIVKIYNNIYRCRYKNTDMILISSCTINTDFIEGTGFIKNNRVYLVE